jgi:hypothetical protein
MAVNGAGRGSDPQAHAVRKCNSEDYLVLTGVEVARTRPRPSSACTATYFAAVIWVLVSNPRFGTERVGRNRVAEEPLSTRQLETVVAPFQLA